MPKLPADKRRIQELEERIEELQEDIRKTRSYLLPQLEQARADFGNLINYFEAKFQEMEHWFLIQQPYKQSKPKPKKGKRR